MDCYLYRELSSFLGFCVCNRILNTDANSNRTLFLCQCKEQDMKAFGLGKPWSWSGNRVTSNFSAFLLELRFKWKHMKIKFLSLLPQVIPRFSISWIFFLVIHDSFALGQPTDMTNLVCSAQYGYNQAVAVPQVAHTRCGLRHCSHLLVLA